EAGRAAAGADQPRRSQSEGLDGGTRLGRATHGASWYINALRTARATTSPCWLRPVWVKVTIACPGRDFEGRIAVTSVSEYSVSPWNNGCGKATSVKPRFATKVPWVRCETEAPMRVARVNMEFTRR